MRRILKSCYVLTPGLRSGEGFQKPNFGLQKLKEIGFLKNLGAHNSVVSGALTGGGTGNKTVVSKLRGKH